FGFELLNLSLSGRPITTSLTSGMPRRDTCVHAPPASSCVWWPLFGALLSSRPWRRLTVVHPPITGSLAPLATRQLVGTSIASVVTLASARSSWPASFSEL